MNPVLATVFEQTSLWLIVFVLASWLSALAYPAIRTFLQRCSAPTRSMACLAIGLVPPLASLVVVVLLMHPVWANALVPEHCHQGVCGSHAPMFQINTIGGMTLVATSIMSLCLLLIFCWRAILHGKRRLAAIFRFASQSDTPRFEMIETAALLAWCCGYWQPQVLVSRGLLEKLSREQLEVVLVHEEAHARRKDNLRHTLLYWSTVFWPKQARQRIRADVANDAEQSCDLAALQHAGDPALLNSVMALIRDQVAPRSTRAQAAFFHPHRQVRTDNSPHSSGLRAWVATWLSWVAHIILLTGLAHFILEWISGLSR
jgi:hypothetical protein